MLISAVADHSWIVVRPRFVHGVLHLKLPTLISVEKPDSGKTFLVELAMLAIGNDRKSGRAFTYTHISEHELEKRCLKNTIPVLYCRDSYGHLSLASPVQDFV
ncbi:hypothetical protein BV898_15367 [Hypsibius exemplaris]|uniref:Uncharacterized protein n=1 Tax=Hypsibius exemplaris TaxID=2072580 RepID=A0A9X6NCL5_HYPEX|nr:hypothetical protein BV898_15367 [Hypsibius exemplaris]